MSEEEKVLPPLRFPDFMGDQPWNVPQLSEISEQILEKVGDRKLETVIISAGFGFVTQSKRFSRDISGSQYKNYILIKKGDFSYNKGNSKKFPQGCIYRLNKFDEVAAPNVFVSFRIDDNYVSDFYKGYFDKNFHGDQISRYITSGARGNGLLNIKTDDFFSIKLPTPHNVKEQRKISDCLSSIDDVIKLEKQKLEALRDHKKGLLQQLFPSEAIAIPPLRFPEFVEDQPWNVPQLSEISEQILEKVGDRKLETVSISAGFGFVTQSKKFSRDISGSQYKNYILIKKGDFSYNKGNSKKFPQGCIYRLNKFDEVAAPNVFVSFRIDDNYVSDFYKGYFDKNFHGDQISRYITSGARGNGLLNIKTDDFFSIKLPTPHNVKEQRKISDCLSSIDDVIELEKQKLEALRDHKKGLLQQLFPNIEALSE